MADFRTFYNCSPADVPVAEFAALVTMLLRNPGSWLQAAVSGWEYPISREGIMLSDLLDVQMASKARKKSDFKAYPRPWSRPKRVGGNNPVRNIDEVRRILRPNQ